jgi:hypothetical protein
MAVLDERRFAPVSYSREELVEEAECLTDTEIAAWLAAEPDDTFEAIMSHTNGLIWGGASYLGSLEKAIRSTYAAKPGRGRRFDPGHAGRSAGRGQTERRDVLDQVIGYDAGWEWVAELRHRTSRRPEYDRIETFVRHCEAGSDSLYEKPDEGGSLAAELGKLGLARLQQGDALSEGFIEGALDSWCEHGADRESGVAR